MYKTLLVADILYGIYRWLTNAVQDCSNSSALAMALLQSCAKPSTCVYMNVLNVVYHYWFHWENDKTQYVGSYTPGR